MKKILLTLISCVCFTGFSDETGDAKQVVCDENQTVVIKAKDVEEIRDMISNLTVRVTQLERRRQALSTAKEKAKTASRSKSKLMISSEVRDSMNLLGERFPKNAIKLNTLPDFKKKKPYVATPKVAPYVPQGNDKETTK